MISIPGFLISTELYSSSHSIVYRARREHDDTPVILKTLRDVYPSPDRLAWLRHEYDLTRSLAAVPGVVQVYGIEQHLAGWVLVLEDIGGDSLAHLGLAGQLDLATFLHLALELTRTLGAVHRQGIIHKDLNPHNIIYNPITDQLCLIDFGLATRLSRETSPFHNTSALEGTLHYLAPEQTGRMNRVVDYRSDFYALGATFYELLTGQVPFTSADALELVHSHIARPPVPPHTLRPDIPAPLSAIILKLLAKDADARYQSAYGLQADLAHCLHQLETMGTIAHFPIGQQDIADHFALPQQLYGREAERAMLLSTFDQVVAGSTVLLLVTGAPGIGKTALVQELYRPLTARRGIFITGKFDQVQRSIPYLAFAQAFRALVRYLLTEPDAMLQEWSEQLRAAVGLNGQVLVEVLPDLELVIGPQPPVPPLGPREARNRFLLVFQHFLAVFTRPEHPLVLFLDDLQWADSGSLKLLEQMLGRTGGGHLLVIGAYRDNEVPPGHPLRRTLDVIQQAGLATQTLMLGTLDVAAVTALVQDTLHVDAPTAQPLANLVQQKTGGNPFFLGEFLKALSFEELLTFDPAQGRWTWDLARIEARQMTDNVVQLLIEQVRHLPAVTQQSLQCAACIGNRFDLSTLAAVRAQPASAIAQQLEPALLAGLVEPLNAQHYRIVAQELAGLAQSRQGEYRFAHDRVKQVTYEQVPADERAAWHWHIGQVLLASIPETEREVGLFDLISQLNAGRARANATERLDLAQLNLTAGRKAKESGAFSAAYAYFQIGLEVLPADAWDAHYALTLALHEDGSEAAYLSGDFDTMERLTATVLEQTHDILDTVKAYEIWMQAASGQGRVGDAVAIGVLGLKRLGLVLPDTPRPEDMAQVVRVLHHHLRKQPVESLLDLPVMTDPTQLAMIQLLMRLAPFGYIAAPTLVPIIVTEAIQRSICGGNAPGSSFAYSAAGAILCGAGDIDTGYSCGLLALHLAERFQDPTFTVRVALVFHYHIRNWKDSFRESVPHLRGTYQVALETGDYEYAGFAVALGGLLSYHAGRHLNDLDSDLAQYHSALLQIKDTFSSDQLAQLRQVIADLRIGTEQPGVLDGEFYNEHAMLPRYQATAMGSSMAFLAIHKLILAYLFDNTALFSDCIALAEQGTIYLMSNPSLVPINMYASLARLRLYPDAPTDERPGILEHVAASQQQLHTWAQHAPMNYRHKWHLVEAECCRVQGEYGAAREHYDHAITGAREHQFLQEEALAYELAGRFYLARAQTDLAHFYLARAHRVYAQWGASAKVQQLEARYPTLFATLAVSSMPHLTTGITLRPSTSSTSHSAALDVASIVKASQAISGEMQFDSLLTRLLLVLLENAGADRGMLLLPHDGEWVVEAEGHIDGTMTVLHSQPLEAAALPHSLLSYVRRTHASVVLDDAPNDGSFTQDAYIQAQQPRSILALPLLHQGVLTGLLYLENTQTAGAFTPARQEVLTLLSGQVAISLESARLYAHLETLVAERTAQLALAEEMRALKDRFVSNMSHELRTPLNSITNFTYILRTGLRGPLTTGQLDYLTRIQTSSERLLTLINGILDLAQLESRRLVLHKTEIHLDELIAGALDTVRGLLTDNPLVIQQHLDAALPPVFADRVRVRQVLLHLLTNAIKFTEEGQITVQAQQVGNEVIISVSDTGIGIPADQLDAIFEPFHQVDEQSTRAFEGAGLGLPLCKQLIALHSGHIWVKSTFGAGSTFAFSLPFTPPDTINTFALPSVLEPGTGPQVLVIDSDPAMGEIVRTYLALDGYSVQSVTDSRQALALIRRVRPALILLDVILPHKDGWEILVDLQASEALRTIPVIVCTIVDEQPLAYALGAAAYLTKPIEAALLRRTVQALTHASPSLSNRCESPPLYSAT